MFDLYKNYSQSYNQYIWKHVRIYQVHSLSLSLQLNDIPILSMLSYPCFLFYIDPTIIDWQGKEDQLSIHATASLYVYDGSFMMMMY